jgi:hypothetical protein
MLPAEPDARELLFPVGIDGIPPAFIPDMPPGMLPDEPPEPDP